PGDPRVDLAVGDRHTGPLGELRVAFGLDQAVEHELRQGRPGLLPGVLQLLYRLRNLGQGLLQLTEVCVEFGRRDALVTDDGRRADLRRRACGERYHGERHGQGQTLGGLQRDFPSDKSDSLYRGSFARRTTARRTVPPLPPPWVPGTRP